MSIYKFSGNLDKWMHQNRAEILEVVEGCLLDNFLVSTKRGTAAIIETPVNCWTSCYKIYFSTDTSAEDEFYRRATA